MRKGLVYLILVGLTLGVSSRATAGIVVAEQLLVDLRAEDLPYGTVARTWINHGTLGDFEPQGVPVVEDVAGRKTVTFDGSSYFEGPLSVPGIEGGGTRSIEVWAYNGPDFVGEETMVSWSHRGGPAGTNIAFNYGNHGTWGAVGHWDAPDMPWSGQHSPAPAASNWWYLVYTYDGTTVRLYVNAEENTTRNVTLNTHGPNIIRVAAQANDSGAGVHAAVNFTGSIAEVRIHDGVLSPAAIANNFRSKPGAPTAADPVPADGQVDVPGDVVLSWAAGEFAAAHDVYFGTVFDDVNTAGRGNPMGVLVSQGQATTTYAPPARLDFGQTYYWRVDEVNAAPDNTIFKGDVWSFTAEPLAYPIANVIATSNAVSEPGAGPENAINGSGLNDADQHSTNNTDMWLGGAGGAEPVWIQFEFDKVYLLHELQVWNYNVIFELMLGFGLKDVTIEHSEDGESWTTFGDVQFAQATARSNYTANTTVDLSGVAARFVRLTANSGWGMTGQFGLSEVRFLFVPVQAREPQPEAGAGDVSVDAILDWRSGRQAASHEVYLGTDEAAVVDGTALVDTISQSQYDPGSLDLDATYYWRIDEVNEAEAIASWAGEVWSFSTQPFIVIDDFESYTDDIEAGTTIFDTWLDGWVNGTGSTVGYLSTPFAERTTVRSGRQSMPLFYEGNSRTDFTMDAQDWTAGGATTLVVHFRGATDNGAGQLYATVNGARVTYPGVLTGPVWKQWNIDLTSLGTNMASVASFSLGVDGSGSGLLFVDDIRLYRAAPEPVAPADPGTAGLVASYAFENNVQDGSGNGYHGTAFNDPAYLASRPGQGQAINFDGFADYVELPIGPIMGTLSSATVATWVDFSGTSGAWQRIFDFGTSSTAGYMFLCPRTGTSGPIRFAITPAGGAGESIVETPRSVPTDGWHHVAVVIDSATMTVQVYVDGEVAASGATTTLPRDLGATTQNWLARSQYTADAYFAGSLDDFAIYSRALSPGEVRYLAGDR